MAGAGGKAPAKKILEKIRPSRNHYSFLRAYAMFTLTYWEQIIRMPNKADKFDLRLRLIKSVKAIGVKPTARPVWHYAKDRQKVGQTL
jgi:hypothetical protein